MEFSQALAYVVALGIAAAIPGPGMTALVARSISAGGKSGFAMLSGLIMGDLIYLSFAVFGLGLTITLGNPKTIAFYLALLPVVIDLDSVSLQSWAFVLVPLTIVILLIVGSIFVLGAVAVRKSLSSVKAQQIIHRGAAGAMLAAAGTMALRS